VHETNQELLKFANALCWHKPEVLPAMELKKRGNAAFGNGKFDGTFFLTHKSLGFTGKREHNTKNTPAGDN
jgi:hypothetical protein